MNPVPCAARLRVANSARPVCTSVTAASASCAVTTTAAPLFQSNVVACHGVRVVRPISSRKSPRSSRSSIVLSAAASPSAFRGGMFRASSSGGDLPLPSSDLDMSSDPDLPDRCERVLDRIDTLNAADPRNVTVRGIDTPYELAYAGWLTVWAKRLARAADNEAGALGPLVFTEEMRIVARGQHVRRWLLPRSSYPEGREGYLKWRNDLKKMHAETVTEIMREEGYFEDQIATVESIILKKRIKSSEQAQVIEDALCMVFLEHQLPDFRKQKGDDDKVVDIIRKTWVAKMGPRGRAAALQLAPSMGEVERRLVMRALEE